MARPHTPRSFMCNKVNPQRPARRVTPCEDNWSQPCTVAASLAVWKQGMFQRKSMVEGGDWEYWDMRSQLRPDIKDRHSSGAPKFCAGLFISPMHICFYQPFPCLNLPTISNNPQPAWASLKQKRQRSQSRTIFWRPQNGQAPGLRGTAGSGVPPKQPRAWLFEPGAMVLISSCFDHSDLPKPLPRAWFRQRRT